MTSVIRLHCKMSSFTIKPEPIDLGNEQCNSINIKPQSNIRDLYLNEKCLRLEHRLRAIFTLSIVCHRRLRSDVFTRARRVTFQRHRIINKATFELNNNVSRRAKREMHRATCNNSFGAHRPSFAA
jgi:hypothetical protein